MKFHSITTWYVKIHRNEIKILDDTKHYICNLVEEATRFLHNYEIHNTVQFAALSTPKNFGNTGKIYIICTAINIHQEKQYRII